MGEFKQYDMAGLLDLDRELKGEGSNQEWSRLDRIYRDNDRGDTVEVLRTLGQGILGNTRPVTVQLLRRIVDRRAGLYHRAPSRFLLDDQGERLPDDHPDHKAMEAALKASQYDLFWREVDVTLALLFQCVIRFYPSDKEGRVVPRLFAPHNVFREPDDTIPNSLDHDRRFALKLSGNTYEYFQRTPGGDWEVAYVNEDGVPLEGQPFEETGGLVPYDLPAMILYDRYPAGQPWLEPSASRAAFHDMINAMANDQWAITRDEAHSLKIVQTDNTSMVPKETGPGLIWVLPKDAEADVLSNQPKLRESLETLESMVRLQAISEDLPASEFDKSKQIVTGAARKIEEGPLRARRDARRALAEQDEKKAYGRYVQVHNYHSTQWMDATQLADHGLDIEYAPMSNPLDAKEVQEANANGMEQGTRSRVDAVMAEHDVGRPEAIRIIRRVDKDMEDFPPPKKPAPQIPGAPDGENPPEADDMDMVQGPELDPKES